MILEFLKKNLLELKNEMENLFNDSNTHGKNLKDIQEIIKIKNTNKKVLENADKFDLTITQLYEYFRKAELDKKNKSLLKETGIGGISDIENLQK